MLSKYVPIAMLAMLPAVGQTTFLTTTERLQARVESVESLRAIKRLQYAYGHYTEFGLWNDFADLFTEDAATNYAQGARGREQVRKLFFDQVGQGRLGLADGRIYPHILYQPVVHLGADGKSAKGRWRILAMLGGMGGSATWYSGVYENEYAIDGGAWKISVLRSEPKITGAYSAAAWRDSGVVLAPHYDVASVAKPVADGVRPGAKSASLGEMAMRASRLVDQAIVTNLQNTYGYAFAAKQWDRVEALFAEDGTLELGLQGVYAGKASIRRALPQFDGEAASRVYLQTLVTVSPDGRTAKARGVELAVSSAEVTEGVFENTFVKQGGAWKIQSVHFYPRFIADAAEGWAKSAKPAPGPSAEFPPDRGPTAEYEIYPKFSTPPFHFDNPVTGKVPQYARGSVAGGTEARAAVTGRLVPGGVIGPSSVEEVDRLVTIAEAYDAVENLIHAHGYGLDRSPTEGQALRVGQMLQPVIDVAADGKSARVRAAMLEPRETPGGGAWLVRGYEASAVLEGGVWTLR